MKGINEFEQRIIRERSGVRTQGPQLKKRFLVLAALPLLFGALASHQDAKNPAPEVAPAPEVVVEAPRPDYTDARQLADEAALRRIAQKIAGAPTNDWDGWEAKENARRAFAECKIDPTQLGC